MEIDRPATTHRFLAAIDLLRFACAVMVVAYHYGTAFPVERGASRHRVLADTIMAGDAVPWTWFGWIGVEIFVVISGYVIFASAEGSPPRAFLRARALRLAPAAWVCASVTAVILLTFPGSSAIAITLGWLDAIAFIPVGFQIDGSYWTLGIEIAFYMVVGIGLRGGTDGARLLGIVLLVGAVSIDYWLVQAAFGDPILYPTRLRMLLLLPHGVFFALGAILRHCGGKRRPDRRLVAFVVVLLWACGLEIVVHTAQIAHDAGLVATAAWPLALFAAAVSIIGASERLQPWCARVVSARTTATLGLITYPLYLIHQEAGAVTIARLTAVGLPYAAAAGLTAILALAFATVCALCAEPWLRTRLRRIRPIHGLAPDSLRTASPPAG